MIAVATAALIPSTDVDAIIAERDAKVRAAEQIEAIASAAPKGFPSLYCDAGRGRESFDVLRVTQLADRDGWRRLVKETGVWTYMDAKARDEWDEQCDAFKFPPLTAETAEATILRLHEQRGSMVARGVAECFRRLGAYKTNRADRFSERMIVSHVLDCWGYIRGDTLDDLNRVLHVLRSLPEPDHRQGADSILRPHVSTDHNGRLRNAFVALFPFFEVRVFKNGNAHVLFRHDADVQRLNMVLSIATSGAAVANGRARQGGAS